MLFFLLNIWKSKSFPPTFVMHQEFHENTNRAVEATVVPNAVATDKINLAHANFLVQSNFLFY
ncbi:hypothetical protein PEPS_27590 (plasmid) [Persicobacter psychrovividus]|uniref:Uncharacterized protein n=1 Tax=Persicobacter psychrovividus TaxID=387638 RepID=A0ABN6LGA0_9BACT|nr:hypothetical protein PEPS_27590 [Persicobacter psychrovividus]